MARRVGLITGCGKGIGLSISKKFLRDEPQALIIALSRSINEDINLLIEKYPDKFLFYKTDIKEFSTINSILKNAYEQYGGIDFAICNAGVRSRSSMIESDIDLYRSILEVNAISNINISKLLIESNLKISKKLNLLLISSIVGSRGFKDLTTYAVAKSALEGFMKSAAVEYGDRNIQVNCIAPGFIKSSYAEKFKETKKDLYQWTIEQTPMKRWGTCEEIAELAYFAVSEKNSYMTGTVLYCDGGWTAK